jgi:hypothetical protein
VLRLYARSTNKDCSEEECGSQHLSPLCFVTTLNVKRRAVIAVGRNPGAEGAHKPAAAHKTPAHKTPAVVAVYIRGRIVGLPAS